MDPGERCNFNVVLTKVDFGMVRGGMLFALVFSVLLSTSLACFESEVLC